MKSDREFMDGIYKKADLLKKKKSKEKYSLNIYIKYSSVAAIFILIPLLLFKSDLLDPPKKIQLAEPKIFSMEDSLYDFSTADSIVVGEIENIKDVAFKTSYKEITISIDNVLKGTIDNNQFLSILSNVDHDFERGVKYLFFIKKEGDGFYYMDNEFEGAFRELDSDTFIDSLGNEYFLEDIKNTIEGDN